MQIIRVYYWWNIYYDHKHNLISFEKDELEALKIKIKKREKSGGGGGIRMSR